MARRRKVRNISDLSLEELKMLRDNISSRMSAGRGGTDPRNFGPGAGAGSTSKFELERVQQGRFGPGDLPDVVPTSKGGPKTSKDFLKQLQSFNKAFGGSSSLPGLAAVVGAGMGTANVVRTSGTQGAGLPSIEVSKGITMGHGAKPGTHTKVNMPGGGRFHVFTNPETARLGRLLGDVFRPTRRRAPSRFG